MKSVFELTANENLTKLVSAQRSLDKASHLFSEVFDEEGAPCDVEEVQEAFFNSLSECEKKVERLMGTVVYHGLFSTDLVDYQEQKSTTSYIQ